MHFPGRGEAWNLHINGPTVHLQTILHFCDYCLDDDYANLRINHSSHGYLLSSSPFCECCARSGTALGHPRSRPSTGEPTGSRFRSGSGGASG